NTIMAIPNYRIQPTGNTRFTYYETPPGTAPAMRAWFYPGDNYGQEFRYPKNPRLLAVASTATVVAPVRPPEPPPPPIVTRPAEPEPARQAEVKPEEPAVIAQNNPPPPPAPQAEPVPAPAPEPLREEPKELPKTATSFPMIGLAGLFSLAAFGLLRLRRS